VRVSDADRDQVPFGQVDILLVMLCLVDCVARRPLA